MKKAILITLLLLSFRLSANYVSFCVDMRHFQPIDPGGINLYVEGDTVFHPMLQDPVDTMIYCVTLDLPSDSCIQYGFLNGSDFYGLEFIPLESRVSDFNSDRWVCIDGPSADTLQLVPMLFSANAPEGLRLVRYKVDLSTTVVSSNGVHVAGSFQGWNPAGNRMHNLDSLIFDVLTYVAPGTYSYLFYNGNTAGDAETVPAVCTVNAYREVSVVNDTVVPTVCFAACTPCITGINAPGTLHSTEVYPNPVVDRFVVQPPLNRPSLLRIYDLTGSVVRDYSAAESYSTEGLPSGTYRISITDALGNRQGAQTIIIH